MICNKKAIVIQYKYNMRWVNNNVTSYMLRDASLIQLCEVYVWIKSLKHRNVNTTE